MNDRISAGMILIQVCMIGSFLSERRKAHAYLTENGTEGVVWITRKTAVSERTFRRVLIASLHSLVLAITACLFIRNFSQYHALSLTMVAGIADLLFVALLANWFWKADVSPKN